MRRWPVKTEPKSEECAEQHPARPVRRKSRAAPPASPAMPDAAEAHEDAIERQLEEHQQRGEHDR